MINIMLIEDNRPFREQFSQFLDSYPEIHCVAALPNALDVIAQVEAIKPDVVLMDINLPRKSGIDAVRELRAHGSDVVVVMHTNFDDNNKVFNSILAGANGYILKSSPAPTLPDIIKEALLGGAPMSPGIASKVFRFLRERQEKQDEPSSTVAEAQTEQDFTERQQEVLQHLRDGLSYKRIADEMNISIDTVRFHVKNIYTLLHVHSKAELMSLKQKKKT